MMNFANISIITVVINGGEIINTSFLFSSSARMKVRMNNTVDRMKPIRGVIMM